MPSERLLRGRCSIRGAFYTLTTVTAGRLRIFEDPLAARCAINALRCSEQEGRTRTFAWVVMPDHVHWLLQLRRDDVARCMQVFKCRSARGVNELLNVTGSLWQRGFHDHCIRDEQALRRHARYIIQNPIRAGLSQHEGEYPHAWCRWPGEGA
mgnify:FL=1